MKLHYDLDWDSLYSEFKPDPSVETCEAAEGVNVAFDAGGAVVGFDSGVARKRLDLSTLAAVPNHQGRLVALHRGL